MTKHENMHNEVDEVETVAFAAGGQHGAGAFCVNGSVQVSDAPMSELFPYLMEHIMEVLNKEYPGPFRIVHLTIIRHLSGTGT